MKENWLKILGVKTFIILSIGKFFYLILKHLNYYEFYLPIKNDIKKLIEDGNEAKVVNNLIYIEENKNSHKYLLRPNTSDKSVFYQVIIQKEYLPLIELVQKYQAQNSIKTIIDAGSNIGLTSLFFKQYYPQAIIISLEPDSANQIQQHKNIEVNNYSDSILLVKKALWKNSLERLNISNGFRDGQHWSKSVIFNNGKYDKSTIETTTLGELMDLYIKSEFLDILKIDIEGSEAVIFESKEFVKTIANRIRFMSIEIHDEIHCRSHIIDTLKKNNFMLQDIGETTFCVNQSLVKI